MSDLPRDVPKAVSDYMAAIGSKGGKAAKGAKKKRPKEHYKKLGEIHRERSKARRKGKA